MHDAVADRLHLAARVGERGVQRLGVAAGAGGGLPALLRAAQERLLLAVDECVLEAA